MAYTLSQLRQTNVMDSALVSAIEDRPFPQFPLDYFEERHARAAHLQKLRHLMPVPGPVPSHVTERELSISARDGHQIRVVHYKPAIEPSSPGPLIVLYHEGGWGMGDLSDEEFNARLFVRDLGATCLNVEYRLAPENPFPMGINDAWDVLKYAAANATELEADPAKGFIVGGSSAGGNFSAVLAHLSRNEGLNPPVTGQWLSVPYLIPSTHVPEKYRDMYISQSENVYDPVLKDGISASTEQLIVEVIKADPKSSLFSVVAEDIYPPTKENQAGKGPLAKGYFQIAGLDPLRDHGLIYDRILREEYGVETRVDLYSGFGHMFWTNWPKMKESEKFQRDVLEGFKWLLNMEAK